MTKNSGVPGKTVPQLERSKSAERRREERDTRTSDQQLKLIAKRPGQSRKEVARLSRLAAALIATGMLLPHLLFAPPADALWHHVGIGCALNEPVES